MITVMTTEQAWKNAIKTIRSNGIRVRQNVMQCCRGCVTADKLGMKTNSDPIVWTYGGQGNAYTIELDDIWYRGGNGWRYGSNVVDEIYWNHDNLTDSQKSIVWWAFTDNGFVVDWDKSDSQCIRIVFNQKNGN